MGTYLLFMVMPAIVWLIFSIYYQKPIHSSDRLKRKYLTVCGILLFLMLGCRHYSVGSGDGGWYYRNWNYLGSVSFADFLDIARSFDMEDGYLAFAWGLSHILKDPQWLFLCYGALVAISVCRFLYLNSDDTVIAFTMFNCLGLWGFMVQGIRQGIAMCICLFAIEFCKKRKPIPFCLLVALAMLFHASAVVFFAAYFLSLLKMNAKGYVIVTVGAVVALFSIGKIFEFVNYVINDTYSTSSTSLTDGGYITAIIYFIILAIAILFHRQGDPDAAKIEYFFYMTLCGLVTFLMRYSINTIAQRVAYYYMFGQLIVLPAMIRRVPGKERALVAMAVVCLCVGIAAYKGTYSVLVPYRFFWQ